MILWHDFIEGGKSVNLLNDAFNDVKKIDVSKQSGNSAI